MMLGASWGSTMLIVIREATDRPGKPVEMLSLWYLKGLVPKGGGTVTYHYNGW